MGRRGATMKPKTRKPVLLSKLTAEFEEWRADVDPDGLCNTFDLALGWFAGTGRAFGRKHARVCELAAWVDAMEDKRRGR